jgi:hypothetical protein
MAVGPCRRIPKRRQAQNSQRAVPKTYWPRFDLGVRRHRTRCLTVGSGRRAHSVVLALVMSLSLDLWTCADIRNLWRATLLSSDGHATQVQYEASAEELLDTDPERAIEGAVLPVHDNGTRHVFDLSESRPHASDAACLTRAPPSA